MEPAKPQPDKPAVPPTGTDVDAPEFLRTVWNDPQIDIAIRVRAAEIVFKGHGEKGKKESKEERAKRAGAGKFAPAAPPQLTRVK